MDEYIIIHEHPIDVITYADLRRMIDYANDLGMYIKIDSAGINLGELTILKINKPTY